MMQPTRGTFLGITPVSSVSNGLYFLTLPLVSVMHVIYTVIHSFSILSDDRSKSLYIKRNVEKVWGVRYTLGARYLSKNMVLGEQPDLVLLLCPP